MSRRVAGKKEKGGMKRAFKRKRGSTKESARKICCFLDEASRGKKGGSFPANGEKRSRK